MASLQDEVDVLRRISLFANIEPARLKLLAFTSDRMSFSEGQELFHEGDAGDAAYVIIDGAVDVLKDTEDGEQLLVTLKKNAFVGDIAILCDVPRTATVRAVGATETLKIQKEHFLRLLIEFPEMAVEVTRVLAQRLQKTTDDLTACREELSAAKGG